MKLKEYIEILSTFDQEAEVVKQVNKFAKGKFLTRIKKSDIIEPHEHFVREFNGGETLIKSFVL